MNITHIILTLLLLSTTKISSPIISSHLNSKTPNHTIYVPISCLSRTALQKLEQEEQQAALESDINSLIQSGHTRPSSLLIHNLIEFLQSREHIILQITKDGIYKRNQISDLSTLINTLDYTQDLILPFNPSVDLSEVTTLLTTLLAIIPSQNIHYIILVKATNLTFDIIHGLYILLLAFDTHAFIRILKGFSTIQLQAHALADLKLLVLSKILAISQKNMKQARTPICIDLKLSESQIAMIDTFLSHLHYIHLKDYIPSSISLPSQPSAIPEDFVPSHIKPKSKSRKKP